MNNQNWARLGLTVENVFDPQRNVCAGKTVLAEAYAIEMRVSCRYNVGKPDCSNGYPQKIATAWDAPSSVVGAVPIAVFTPEPPMLMVNAIRGGGPPVPVLTNGTVEAVIHKRR